jgi:hypothetical protein
MARDSSSSVSTTTELDIVTEDALDNWSRLGEPAL